jgi:hypothetical protein
MMEQLGTSESVANNMNEFISAINEGKIFELANRDSESTTPTTIEDFAKTFTHVFNMS